MSIISHSKKFIFLKSRKTAGTSLSVPFAKLCDSDDIMALSQDVIDETGLRRQNIRRSFVSMSVYSILRHIYFLLRNANRLGTMETLWPTYQQHMTVAELREAVGDKIWKNYYKFTIERNPYDRLVSFYNWRKHRFSLEISFNDFALAVLTSDPKLRRYTHGFSNRPFYLDKNNNVCVDRIVLFEDFQKGVEAVFSDLGLDMSQFEIPNFKGGIRQEKNYRSLYSDELRCKAEKAFALEKKLFGYEF